MAHMSGKMSPPTAQCGSTKASCRLGTPTVSVSVLASVRAAADVLAPVAAVVAAPAAAVVVAPLLAAVVVAPPAAVVVDEPLLSPPHAASNVPNAASPVVARNERREYPNPNVPGSIGGIDSS